MPLCCRSGGHSDFADTCTSNETHGSFKPRNLWFGRTDCHPYAVLTRAMLSQSHLWLCYPSSNGAACLPFPPLTSQFASFTLVVQPNDELVCWSRDIGWPTWNMNPRDHKAKLPPVSHSLHANEFQCHCLIQTYSFRGQWKSIFQQCFYYVKASNTKWQGSLLATFLLMCLTSATLLTCDSQFLRDASGLRMPDRE